jgi:PAS domain S-box-containing protein
MDNQTDMELFFHLSRDLFCVAGFDGYFKKINQSVLDTLGYSEEELVSRPIDSFVFPADRAVTEVSRENLRKSIPLLNFENRYVTKSGELVWLSWTSVPVPNHEQVFAVGKNITHKKKQEDDRNVLLNELANHNRELKQLLYTAMHDLRAPVSNITMMFRVFDVANAVKDEESLENIELVKLCALNIESSLNSYMDLLIEKNNFNPKTELLKFEESYTRINTSLRSLISDSRATLHTDFSQAASVWFNPTYLDSIFLNLITNSIKYARPTVFPTIVIQSRVQEGGVALVVEDNGRGLDMSKVGDRIFQFNQRFHDHDDSKGVGLYLIRNHLTNLGGTISVESAPDQGTRFTLFFRAKSQSLTIK